MIYSELEKEDVPIDLAMVKSQWLYVDHNQDDETIQEIIDSAISFAEEYTGQTLSVTKYQCSCSMEEIATGIKITKNPIHSLDSISFIDKNKQVQQINLDDYSDFYFTVMSTSAFIAVNPKVFNGNETMQYNAVNFTFTTYSVLDKNLTIAIKQLVAFYYENRGDVVAVDEISAPPEAIRKLQKNRVMFV